MKISRARLVWTMLAVLLTHVLSGCGRHDESIKVSESGAFKAQVTEVKIERQPAVRILTGVVRPESVATLSAKVSGVILGPDVKLGQRVQAGEVVVRLSAPELSARAKQAQAALAQARRQYERELALQEKGVSAAESVRDLADRLRGAEAASQEAEAMSGHTEVVAPFTGVITRDLGNVGDLAVVGQPLLSIEGEGAWRVDLAVPESVMVPPLGGLILVEPEHGGAGWDGVLVEMSPAASSADRNRQVKLALPASAVVRSGQYVRVSWPLGLVERILVPDTAVSNFGQLERIYVVADGVVHMRIVKTGIRIAGRVEIVSGVQPGEIVVNTPPPQIRDGVRMEVSR